MILLSLAVEIVYQWRRVVTNDVGSFSWLLTWFRLIFHFPVPEIDVELIALKHQRQGTEKSHGNECMQQNMSTMMADKTSEPQQETGLVEMKQIQRKWNKKYAFSFDLCVDSGAKTKWRSMCGAVTTVDLLISSRGSVFLLSLQVNWLSLCVRSSHVFAVANKKTRKRFSHFDKQFMY